MGKFDFKDGEVSEFDGVLIVGAGLVGSLAAVTLSQKGHNVLLIERCDDWEIVAKQEAGEEQEKNTLKRSINLALSHRGEQALNNVGVLDEVMQFTIPMRGRAIHNNKSTTECVHDAYQPYDEMDSSNFIKSVGRERLNMLLVNKAKENENVKVLFGLRLTHVDKSGVAHFEDRPSEMEGHNTFNDYKKGRLQIKPRLVLGCDGAHSVTRESMLRTQTMNLERTFIKHGYKELCMPATASGDFALDEHEALHIWPRDEFMMIALPNPDRSFTCTIFAPFETETDEDGKHVKGLLDLKTDQEIEEYFQEYFPDIPSVIPDYLEQFKRNPACRLVTVKTEPWNKGSSMLLLGDAAHAMVPFYGQGMNSGFEDVLFLDEVLSQCGNDLEKTVPLFAQQRQPNGFAIKNLSLRNYVEMRHHTGSLIFLLRKKLEGVLNYLFPTWWIPLYKMVAFTRIPYATAVKREERQSGILSMLSSAGVVGVAAAALWATHSGVTSESGPCGSFFWRSIHKSMCGMKVGSGACPHTNK